MIAQAGIRALARRVPPALLCVLPQTAEVHVCFGFPPLPQIYALGNTCEIDAYGETWCWGENRYGQIGDGSLDKRLVPTPVMGGGFDEISAYYRGDRWPHVQQDRGRVRPRLRPHGGAGPSACRPLTPPPARSALRAS